MNTVAKCLCALAFISLPYVAASETVFDVTGVGTICNYTGSGTNSVCTQGIPVTGTIAINVNPAFATTPGYRIDSAGTAASDLNGWVTSSFSFVWSGGSYTSSSVSGETYADSLTEVMNDPTQPLQSLLNRFISQSSSSNYYSENYGFLQRETSASTWLSGLSFPESAALAPGSNNLTGFINEQASYNSTTQQMDYTGATGNIYLSYMAPVPEPSTVWLLLSGLGGLSVFGRTRKS
jgi:hypothetical protein